MIARTATPGELVVDSYTFSMYGTAAQAKALAAEGVKCLVGYLGAMTPARVGYLHDAGIAFMPVTFGTAPAGYNGLSSVSHCKTLGLPDGVSVWLDLEGLAAFHDEPADLISRANAWANIVEAAGWMPCLYQGSPQPLTSAELYALKHVRYWLGQGLPRDRHNAPATPACGYTMKQGYPSLVRGGIMVDDNTLEPDKLGRLPVWAVK